MKTFRKILSIMLIVSFAIVLTGNSASAQQRRTIRSTGAIESNQDAILPAGTWVYGLKIYADEANSVMSLYDAATAPIYSAADELDQRREEIGEATQYDSKIEMFDNPRYFEDGVSVMMSTGIGFIYYGPSP